MNKATTINDIALLNKENYSKSTLPKKIKYLDTGSLTKNRIENLHILDTNEDEIPSRAQRKVGLNTILYSTVRPIQEHYGIIENIIDDLVVSTGFTTIDIKDENTCSKYVYYLLTQRSITEHLHSIGMNAVSSYPSISPDDIGNLCFSFPELSVQRKIAKVLSNLDSKIELNNKINQELEAMAKLLYDYWFVQFDFPNEQGKPYKSSGGKMVYNEELKKEIPEGWEVKKLSEIANIVMGQSPSGSSYNVDADGVIFFQGSTDFGWRFPTIRQYTTAPSRMAAIGDVLLSVRAPVGTLNIADKNCCIGRGLAALNSKDGYTSYLYYVMEYFKQIFDHRNNSGTTFGAITKDDLFSLKVVYPDDGVLRLYDSQVGKYNEKILNNHQQNLHLSDLRDWLLPMLMNGQISVSGVKERLDMAAEPIEDYKSKI